MRLWSLRPKYLDKIGLVALWREALLAKKVLEHKTKGYKNHPQLERFKNSENPVGYINAYLKTVYDEGLKRGYAFDKSKFKNVKVEKLKINDGQIEYEFKHLKKKLKVRSPADYKKLIGIKRIYVNPIFSKRKGPVESWEKL